jgi:hypothetical protein
MKIIQSTSTEIKEHQVSYLFSLDSVVHIYIISSLNNMTRVQYVDEGSTDLVSEERNSTMLVLDNPFSTKSNQFRIVLQKTNFSDLSPLSLFVSTEELVSKNVFEKTIQDLQEELTKSKALSQTLQEELTKSKGICQTLQEEITKIKGMCQTLQEEKCQLEESLKKKRAEIDKLLIKNDLQASQHDTTKHDNQTLKEEIDRLKEAKRKLQEELKNIKEKQIEDLQKEKEKLVPLELTKNNLTLSIENMTKTVEDVTKQKTQLANDNLALQKKIVQIESERRALQERLQSFEAEKENEEREITILRKQNEVLLTGAKLQGKTLERGDSVRKKVDPKATQVVEEQTEKYKIIIFVFVVVIVVMLFYIMYNPNVRKSSRKK